MKFGIRYVENFEKCKLWWYLGEADVLRVSDNSAIGLFVASVHDELRVPKSEVLSSFHVLREDGDTHADVSAVGGELDVPQEGFHHLLRCRYVPAIEQFQLVPVHPCNASGGVTPSQFGSE